MIHITMVYYLRGIIYFQVINFTVHFQDSYIKTAIEVEDILKMSTILLSLCMFEMQQTVVFTRVYKIKLDLL